MAETLGSICDKLTIVKLKQYHTEDEVRLSSLALQEEQLKEEMNDFILAAINGDIPVNRLSFKANKVYKESGNEIREITGSLGEVFGKLAEINCLLWHEQEKVYEFESVPALEKDSVVKQLAILNLERNKCIDEIDRRFIEVISSKLK
jgi:hypothetical protein